MSNKFNPRIHHRRSVRLQGYDYSLAGLYFITICCENMERRFGKVDNGEMILNEFGQIAQEELQRLPERYPNIKLDVFQIMPNHVHFILEIVRVTRAVAHNGETADPTGTRDQPNATDRIPDNDNVIANHDGAIATIGRGTARIAPTVVNNDCATEQRITVGNIVGAYKSLVAHRCLKLCKQRNESLGTLWQRNYYESIIRNRCAHEQISEYVLNNPVKWESDRNFRS